MKRIPNEPVIRHEARSSVPMDHSRIQPCHAVAILGAGGLESEREEGGRTREEVHLNNIYQLYSKNGDVGHQLAAFINIGISTPSMLNRLTGSYGENGAGG